MLTRSCGLMHCWLQAVAEVVAADDVSEAEQLSSYQERPSKPSHASAASAAPPAAVTVSRTDSTPHMPAPAAAADPAAAQGAAAAAAAAVGGVGAEDAKRQQVLTRLQGEDRQLESGLKVSCAAGTRGDGARQAGRQAEAHGCQLVVTPGCQRLVFNQACGVWSLCDNMQLRSSSCLRAAHSILALPPLQQHPRARACTQNFLHAQPCLEHTLLLLPCCPAARPARPLMSRWTCWLPVLLRRWAPCGAASAQSQSRASPWAQHSQPRCGGAG